MWGKYKGKICRENISGKYVGKHVGKICGEKYSTGSLVLISKTTNIPVYCIVYSLHCTQAEDFCGILRIELLSRDRMLQYLQDAARHSSAISLDTVDRVLLLERLTKHKVLPGIARWLSQVTLCTVLVP